MELLNVRQIGVRLGCESREVYKLVSDGLFPKPVMGIKKNLWSVGEANAAIAAITGGAKEKALRNLVGSLRVKGNALALARHRLGLTNVAKS